MKIIKVSIYSLILCAVACSSAGKSADTLLADSQVAQAAGGTQADALAMADKFCADSAYSHVATQLAFGPRVPGTAPHRECGEWLTNKLQGLGAKVSLQELSLRAFDGTVLPAKNILGQFNPQASDRTLLVAHWDTRPWADQDPDPANRSKPVPGANDGASGVAVLLEVARVLSDAGMDKGVDILFVDAEDYGTEGDDMSWALGARAFVQAPPVAGYRPQRVILLDMVGGKGTSFPREMFSDYNAPELLNEVWRCADMAGHSGLFVQSQGGAITDDHVEFLRAGIPAIDIVAFSETGFAPTWHTLADNLENIDPAILRAVGRTVLTYLYTRP